MFSQKLSDKAILSFLCAHGDISLDIAIVDGKRWHNISITEGGLIVSQSGCYRIFASSIKSGSAESRNHAAA